MATKLNPTISLIADIETLYKVNGLTESWLEMSNSNEPERKFTVECAQDETLGLVPLYIKETTTNRKCLCPGHTTN